MDPPPESLAASLVGSIRVTTAAASTGSLPIGWLPQLDSVALRVNHPAELPVLGFVDLLFNVHALRSKHG
jgi:hypothetical protein